jgi:hypothetical protein
MSEFGHPCGDKRTNNQSQLAVERAILQELKDIKFLLERKFETPKEKRRRLLSEELNTLHLLTMED